MMKKNFMRLASVLMCVAFGCLPLAGQEKAVMKTGAGEYVPKQGVQLRAEEELPDSAIVYSPEGERKTKYVYPPNENSGTYARENNAWIFTSSGVETRFMSRAKYDRKIWNEQSKKVSYGIVGDQLRFYIPWTNVSYFYYYYPASLDFRTDYDANGNLTSFRGLNDDGNVTVEFTASYNMENNPVFIEGIYTMLNQSFYKAHYEYNEYGYATLYDGYEWDTGKKAWVSRYRQIVGYDAQGKVLYEEQYAYSEMEWRGSYKYYDEHHFSSILDESFKDGYSNEETKYKYSENGKLGAGYDYENGELREYWILYPNSLTPDDYPGDVGNKTVAGAEIYGYGGSLHIRMVQPATLNVYTLSGALLHRQTLPAGETAVPLPQGAYVVKVGNVSRKLLITN
jgi:hypothetical protein